MVAASVTVPSEVVAVAVIVAEPAAIPVTTPLELTVATLVSEDLHSTRFVTVKLELSRNLPAAPNDLVFPTFMAALLGLNVRAVSAVAATVTYVEALTPSLVAFAVVFAVPLPLLCAVTIPCASTLATDVLELLHVAVLLTSTVSPPTVVAVAANCFASPTTMK